MNWIFQTEGLINQYRGFMRGTQPVRVLNEMIFEMFKNTNPTFFGELVEVIESGRLNKELDFVCGEDSIYIGGGVYRTPKIIDDKLQINIHETFLSFLWATVYAVFVRYIETIDYPRMNAINGWISHPVTPENMEQAEQLFDYARYLVMDFAPWDKDKLPNPELYLAQKRTYVEQTNIYYTDAMKFILCHEYAHLRKEHISLMKKATHKEHFHQYENEADNDAIELMISGMPKQMDDVAEGKRLASELGIVFGILAMFFFRSRTDGTKHPNSEDRLTNAMEKLQLSPDHHAWGIACVGLEMWDKQFELNFEWTSPVPSYRDLISR